MFEKLLSLVPYNPGLIPQLSFYSRRLREEASIRRTGTAFLVLAFLLQFFVVLNPPQPSFANDSGNNLLPNGFTSAADARAQCEANTRDFEHILRHYGIHCSSITDDWSYIHVDSGVNYYSMGHHTYSSQDIQTPIDGVNLYWRPLSSVALQNQYHALKLHNDEGKLFYLLSDCGNLVSIGFPTPVSSSQGGGQTSSGGNGSVESPTPPPVPPQTPTPPPSVPPCQYNSALPADSPYCLPPQPPSCQYNATIPATSTECKPCQASSNGQDSIACIKISKSAVNDTVGGNANHTTAHAGDVITYTLNAENTGKATINQFQFQDNFADVLVYANITDLHGGSLDAFQNVSWPNIDILPGQTVTHNVTVKVKNPIPQTPSDPASPNRFDLTMTNAYGNVVSIKLPGSPAKHVEVAAASLPNTGPGTSLFIAAAIVVVAGYFYSRASLLARESEIAVKETATV